MAVVAIDKVIVERFAKQLTTDLKNSVASSGITASGELENSFRYELTDKSLRVYAAKHAGAAEDGRKPTANTGTGALRKAIRQWIDDKGIIPKPDSRGRTPSKDSLAYIIARSIHQNGTLLFRGTDFYGRTKPTKIIRGVVNDGRIDDLRRSLITSFVSSIKNQL